MARIVGQGTPIDVRSLRVYDVSPTIAADTPMWHTHPQPVITALAEHRSHGVAANLLTLSEHTGSHVDAPFHFDPDGATIAEIPCDALLLKPYAKYDLAPRGLQAGELATVDDLRDAQTRGGFETPSGGVAVISFGWDRNLPGGEAGRDPQWWGRNEPGLAADACEHLAAAGVVAVASDTGACDVSAADGQSLSAHGHRHAFLPRGILIVEGLVGLAAVPSTGLFLALPLKIAGGTGSPARVVLLGP